MRRICVISLFISASTFGCETAEFESGAETVSEPERSDIARLVWAEYPLGEITYPEKGTDHHEVIESQLVIIPFYGSVVDQGFEKTIEGRLGYQEFVIEALDFIEAKNALSRVEQALKQIPVLKDKNLTEYISEAVGFRVGDKRYIAFNFVDESWIGIRKNRMTIVHGGGPDFFQLSYSLTQEEIVRLKMNG